jgi:hypothetical protein
MLECVVYLHSLTEIWLVKFIEISVVGLGLELVIFFKI